LSDTSLKDLTKKSKKALKEFKDQILTDIPSPLTYVYQTKWVYLYCYWVWWFYWYFDWKRNFKI